MDIGSESVPPTQEHAPFMKTDNRVFWALVKLVDGAETNQEMTRIAKHADAIKHYITEDQWNRLKILAVECRKKLKE